MTPSSDEQNGPTSARQGKPAGQRSGPPRLPALLRVGVVLVLMGAAAGAATMVPPVERAATQSERNSNRVPLNQTTMVCPTSASGDKHEASTQIGAVSALADVPRPGGKGTLRLRGLGESKPVKQVEKVGHALRVTANKQHKGPMVISADGALAPGAAAGGITRALSTKWRGLAEMSCVRPGAEFWFVGSGSERGRHPQLYVTNVEDSAARVNVTIYDKQGEVQTEKLRGVDIDPHSQWRLKLDEVAPLSDRLAVHVTANRGRVAVNFRDHLMVEGKPAGIAWVPPTADPAKRVVVPGLVGGKGERILTVVAPGSRTASVDVNLLGPNGSFEPTKHGTIQVGPNKVQQVDLSKVNAKQAGAVLLESDVPISASMRSVLPGSGDDSRPDFAYAPAGEPLGGPAVVPWTPTTGDKQSDLLLSNSSGDQPASARVELIGPEGQSVTTTSVEVAPGATKVVDLSKAYAKATKGQQKQSGAGFTLVVAPGDKGQLHGVRVLTEEVDEDLTEELDEVDSDDWGPMIATRALHPAPLTALRPVVHSDLTP